MSQLDDQVKGIKGWLEKQGFPLEMAVARVLSRQGLEFMQGWHYEDPDTNDTREIDILSSSVAQGKNTLLIRAIIECKYSEQPMVGFTYNSQLRSPAESWVPCNPLGRSVLKKLRSKELINELPIFSQQNIIAYTLRQTIRDEDNKKRKDSAFEAIMSVVKASYALSKWHEKVQTFSSTGGEEQIPPIFIGIPTIVLRAPLFICYLDQHGEIAVEPRRGFLLEWTYPKVGLMMIRVIQEIEVANLGKNISDTARIFSNQLNEYI